MLQGEVLIEWTDRATHWLLKAKYSRRDEAHRGNVLFCISNPLKQQLVKKQCNFHPLTEVIWAANEHQSPSCAYSWPLPLWGLDKQTTRANLKRSRRDADQYFPLLLRMHQNCWTEMWCWTLHLWGNPWWRRKKKQKLKYNCTQELRNSLFKCKLTGFVFHPSSKLTSPTAPCGRTLMRYLICSKQLKCLWIKSDQTCICK